MSFRPYVLKNNNDLAAARLLAVSCARYWSPHVRFAPPSLTLLVGDRKEGEDCESLAELCRWSKHLVSNLIKNCAPGGVAEHCRVHERECPLLSII